MKSIITSENLLNIRLVPASCRCVLEVKVGSDCSTSYLATWVRCCTSSPLGAQQYILSVQLFNTRAFTLFVTHSDNVSTETGCLKGKKKHLNEQRWAAGRYLTQVTLWAHHWFWWQPLPYRTDDILFKRAGRWQDNLYYQVRALVQQHFTKSLYFSLPLSLSLPLHSFI